MSADLEPQNTAPAAAPGADTPELQRRGFLRTAAGVGVAATGITGFPFVHAQEKIVNVPGAETSGKRGGIHNSVTRAVTKPTHMIGGYAQLSWGFNYYGTVGANRDEFVIVRKMKNVDWMERPLAE